MTFLIKITENDVSVYVVSGNYDACASVQAVLMM